MSVVDYGRVRVHKDCIERYRRLLRTSVTDIERRYMERRLSQETSALQALLRFDAFAAAHAATKRHCTEMQGASGKERP